MQVACSERCWWRGVGEALADTLAGFQLPVIVAAFVIALVVIAIASGATAVSHVNDSGFWLVNRYLGMTEKETLASWTALVTIIGFTGFTVAALLSLVVG